MDTNSDENKNELSFEERKKLAEEKWKKSKEKFKAAYGTPIFQTPCIRSTLLTCK